MNETVTDLGLRQRGKARRKLAIIEAGLNLFAERGYDATTVADIAAAAEVAPRTIAHYFPSKQDIALSPFSDAADRLIASLGARSPHTTALDVLEEWLATEAEQLDPWDAHLCRRMFAANPELAALRAARLTDALTQVRIALAADLGLEASDPVIQVIGSAAAGIVVDVASMPAGPARTETQALGLHFLRTGIDSVRPTAFRRSR